MKKNYDSVKKIFDNDSEDESDDESATDSDGNDNSELFCKNMDPALAKLMGIIIEEQKMSDWTPPTKSGLDNSEAIVSSAYLKIKVLERDILNHKTLNEKQLEYIKTLNNEDKLEIIHVYNQAMNNIKK